jgi:hypothetical protein
MARLVVTDVHTPAGSPAFSILGFAAIWIATGFIGARIGGWHALAEIYRAEAGAFLGDRWRMRSASLRMFLRYNGIVTFGANERGLYLAVFVLFRAGHPPLFIPWTEIEVSNERGIVFTYTTFRFRRVPDVTLRVAQGLGGKILEAARS